MKPKPLTDVLIVYKSQLLAALIALGIIAVFFPVATVIASFSFGEAIMLIANGFLTLQVYRQRKKLIPITMLASFIGGEFGKYCIIIGLTILIARNVPALNWLYYAIGIATPQLFGLIIYSVRNRC